MLQEMPSLAEYNRSAVLRLTTKIGDSVCKKWESDIENEKKKEEKIEEKIRDEKEEEQRQDI